MLHHGNFPLVATFKKLLGAVVKDSNHATTTLKDALEEKGVGGFGSVRWFVWYDTYYIGA